MNRWKQERADERVLTDLSYDILADERRHQKIDRERVNTVEEVYDNIQELVSGDNVSTSISLHKPFNSVGCVSIKGKSITINNPREFAEQAIQCQMLNIWADLDGIVSIDLSFRGLTK